MLLKGNKANHISKIATLFFVLRASTSSILILVIGGKEFCNRGLEETASHSSITNFLNWGAFNNYSDKIGVGKGS